MELRGFDSYEVSLGDELRGERACRGWSLRDASRELCIKPALIEAIENADVAAFPNRSVVPGYVRSYARYLDLDADEIYRRFCEESGFESSLATYGMTTTHSASSGAAVSGTAGALSGAVGADFTASRFAVKPAPRRIGAAVSLGGIVSVVGLAGLVSALCYGGYLVLQDIQRVGIAPLPEAPAVVADAPVIPEPGTGYAAAADRPAASVYDEDGVLLAFAPPETLATPAPARRDGPIAAIDPNKAGLIAAAYEPAPETAVPDAVPTRTATTQAAAHSATFIGPVLPAALSTQRGALVETVANDGAPTDAHAAQDDGSITVVASDRAWVRVRGAEREVLFEGILEAGDTFQLPTGADGATLRAGNAGGIFIALGPTRFGPLGRSGQVVKRVSLDADTVRTTLPKAEVASTAVNDSPGTVAGLAE
ncbi:MAG: helix-turn-helix domain-containing protein [Pseudomonadota bacterium]